MARLVVVAPGRGSYGQSELRYLSRFADHPATPHRRELAAGADRLRRRFGRIPVSTLDGAERYQPGKHVAGENVSALIFTCAAADFALIAREHRIAAVLGNSMGWYTTLFTGGALSFEDAFSLVDTMGAYQKNNVVGGQIIYPLVDDQWRLVPGREDEVFALLERVRARGEEFAVDLSIRLGGSLVLAGAEAGIHALLAELPKIQLGAYQYPFRLAQHAAFHTQLMLGASRHGLDTLPRLAWRQPDMAMIDGNGRRWFPGETRAEALRDYTLVDQVLKTYDFTASVRVALREYNPDHLVLLGPGETLTGAIAQVMIAEGWRGLRSKSDFMDAQKSGSPPLVAINRPEQARHII